jgi:hypothetical protein
MFFFFFNLTKILANPFVTIFDANYCKKDIEIIKQRNKVQQLKIEFSTYEFFWRKA